MNTVAFLEGFGGSELVLLLFIPFWAWMLLDCIKREEDKTQKIVWTIVIAVPFLIGAPLYFFFRKLPRKSARLHPPVRGA